MLATEKRQYVASKLTRSLAGGRTHLVNCFKQLRQANIPYDCCMCREPELSGGLCNSCLKLLPYNTHCCPRCALPDSVSVTGQPVSPDSVYCASCSTDSPPYRQATVPLVYGFPADYLIGQFKYAGDMVIGRVLGELLGGALSLNIARSPNPPEIIVPVPQSPVKLSRRGFNQAAELSRYVSAATGIPVNSGALTRLEQQCQSEDSHQRKRSRSTRLRRNSLGFEVSATITDRVLLIDDVMTTGATLSAAANVLSKAGATVVDVAAVARTRLG